VDTNKTDENKTKQKMKQKQNKKTFINTPKPIPTTIHLQTIPPHNLSDLQQSLIHIKLKKPDFKANKINSAESNETN
jgi:hypothetical protein